MLSKRESIAKTLYERIYYTKNRRADDPKGYYAWPPTSTKKWLDHADAVLKAQTEGCVMPLDPLVVGDRLRLEGCEWLIHTLALRTNDAGHPKNIVGIVRIDVVQGTPSRFKWIPVNVAVEYRIG